MRWSPAQHGYLRAQKPSLRASRTRSEVRSLLTSPPSFQPRLGSSSVETRLTVPPLHRRCAYPHTHTLGVRLFGALFEPSGARDVPLQQQLLCVLYATVSLRCALLRCALLQSVICECRRHELAFQGCASVDVRGAHGYSVGTLTTGHTHTHAGAPPPHARCCLHAQRVLGCEGRGRAQESTDTSLWAHSHFLSCPVASYRCRLRACRR